MTNQEIVDYVIKTPNNTNPAILKQTLESQDFENRPDWNQNDPEAPDYVKNRTHWEETSTVILVDSLTSEDYRNGNYPNCTFVPGQKYNVVWNSVLYEDLVCQFDGEYNIIALQDNGLQFYIDDNGGNGLYIEDLDESFTVSISTVETIIHKLDPKYIPDDIGGQADWNQNDPTAADYVKNRPFYSEKVIKSVYSEIIETESANSRPSVNLGFSATYGETLTVVFDGVSYNCEVFEFEYMPAVGNAVDAYGHSIGNGEPFCISIGMNKAWIKDAGTHTIEILQDIENVKTIDSKFIPSGNRKVYYLNRYNIAQQLDAPFGLSTGLYYNRVELLTILGEFLAGTSDIWFCYKASAQEGGAFVTGVTLVPEDLHSEYPVTVNLTCIDSKTSAIDTIAFIDNVTEAELSELSII